MQRLIVSFFLWDVFLNVGCYWCRPATAERAPSMTSSPHKLRGSGGSVSSSYDNSLLQAFLGGPAVRLCHVD